MKDGDDGAADGQITHRKDVVDGAANDKPPTIRAETTA